MEYREAQGYEYDRDTHDSKLHGLVMVEIVWTVSEREAISWVLLDVLSGIRLRCCMMRQVRALFEGGYPYEVVLLGEGKHKAGADFTGVSGWPSSVSRSTRVSICRRQRLENMNKGIY